MAVTDDSARSDTARGRSPSPEPDDWPTQAADTIERVVGTVRDKTTGPILTVARAIVYGLFAAFTGLTLAVLFAVALVRLLDAYLPEAVFGSDHVWAAHGLVGLVFVAVGLFCWSKALSRPRQ